jgi:hypothetical protein
MARAAQAAHHARVGTQVELRDPPSADAQPAIAARDRKNREPKQQ